MSNEAFLGLSAALTGFSRADLRGTGMADLYWKTLQFGTPQKPGFSEKAEPAEPGVGEETAYKLLAAWETVQNSGNTKAAMRAEILSQPDLGPAARNLIKMWYLGDWQGGNPRHAAVVSGEAYQQALVWDAIGAHPQAAKQQGFGVWSLPPNTVGEE